MSKTIRKPLIITFIGPVGVGKTTQMKLLKQYFEKRNAKTVVTYIKSAHGLSYLLLALIRVLRGRQDQTTSENRNRIELTRRIDPLWHLTETLSISTKFLFTVYLPFKLGYNVLMEEGVLMSIENYRRFRPKLLGLDSKELPFLNTLLRWTQSQNHLDIILDAREVEAKNRRLSRSFRRIESNEYVDLQRKVMSSIKGPNVLYIDTSKRSAESVHKMITNHIEKKIYKK